jgi:methylmalonyl-CoA/ethylmalonyl-CoA epimerase
MSLLPNLGIGVKIMKKKSPAKVRPKTINQVAIVVKDIERVVENYWNILGIGPWTIYNWEEPLVYERKYHGKAAVAREKLAIAQVGDVELELVQAVEGPSIYRDWIEEHGEGLHHVEFLVDTIDDYDKTVEVLVQEGFSSIQSGRFGTPEQGYAFNYIEIPPLRAIWEPVYEGKLDTEAITFP